MNVIDIFVVLGLSFFGFKGYTKGLVHEVLSLTAVLAGLVAAFRWTPGLAPRLADSVPGPAFVDSGVAFLIVFALVLAAGRYFQTMIERVWTQPKGLKANMIAGASFGIFKGAVILGCTILALRSFAPEAHAAEDVPPGVAGHVVEINGQVEQSFLAARLADLTGGVFSKLTRSTESRVQELIAGKR